MSQAIAADKRTAKCFIIDNHRHISRHTYTDALQIYNTYRSDVAYAYELITRGDTVMSL